LDGLLDGLPPRQLAGAVERLMGHYRGRTPTDAPILRDRADAVAYAAYRMPATYQAVAAALAELAARLPGWAPESQLDIGGGTGAAVWATAGVWPDERPVTVLDWAGPALDLGRELAGAASVPALRSAEWRRQRITRDLAPPRAELITVSYVLGELAPQDRDALVTAVAGAAGRAVLLAEPGSPDGYRRVIRARDQLIAAGLRVLAPCPHSARCPMEQADDWCHFGARVSRSSLHRRVKGGELPYEDEKYSYVAAVRPAAGPGTDAPAGPESGPGTGPAAARIVRRPQARKGQVLLDLCTREEGLRRVVESKRDRERYRAARDAGWGDPWPP
jgi:ribosomal protein RSM22 (predicted rRNA methylase)